MQFHILSSEGPDRHSRAGGLATRVEGVTNTLAELGYASQPWFGGIPMRPATPMPRARGAPRAREAG